MIAIKTVFTSTWKKYYKFSNKQCRLFPMKKMEAEAIIASGNYEDFIVY